MNQIPSYAPSEVTVKPTGLARLWASHKTYRATLAELRALTERQLGDIGLTRHALKMTARRAAYGY